MMRMTGHLSTICDECKRAIMCVVALPIGKTAMYGCRDCKTPLLYLYAESDGMYRVDYLRNTLGGLSNIQFIDF